MSAPCATCPWRRSSTVGGADIPGFGIDLMRSLACTVGEGDAFRKIMACHGSPEGEESICRGYAAVEGWSNIAVRLGAAQGSIDLAAIMDAAEGLDLYGSFAEMLADYEDAHDE